MTDLELLELLVSLSLQVGLITVVTGIVVRLGPTSVRGDLLWFYSHVALAAVTLAAFTLPHLRLFTASPGPFDRVSQAVDLNAVSAVVAKIWLAGALLSLVQLFVATSRLSLVLRESVDAPDSVHRLHHVTIGAKQVRVLVSRTALSPFCWQIHQPTIVLPEFILDWPIETIDWVVRHEVEHLRSQHPMHLFCQRVIECFFWFHPLVRWTSRDAARHREFHCDAMCVSTHGNAAGYLRSLLRLAEKCQVTTSGLATGATFVGATSLVQQRATRIVDWDQAPASTPVRKPASGRLTLPILLIAFLATAIWIPINPTASRRSIWSPWPPVSADVLHTLGITVVDYEIDGHRLRRHDHP